jgi:hypothetical protein
MYGSVLGLRPRRRVARRSPHQWLLDGHVAPCPSVKNCWCEQLSPVDRCSRRTIRFCGLGENVIEGGNDASEVARRLCGRERHRRCCALYELALDPSNPRHAVLSVVLDSAVGDDIVSPDNLGISQSSLLIQEDRNWKHSGYNRVLVYDLSSGSLTPVARTDPSQDVIDAKGVGAWESSGVVDASEFFGQGWWLLDVQAHYTEVGVPGPTLEPDSATGEGGQLELVYIPAT